jgi:serine/threonine protein kinase
LHAVSTGQKSCLLEVVDDPDNEYELVRGDEGHVHQLFLFRREAELFGSLDHPNIVKLIGVVRDGHGDITAMVMELASGTLEGVCSRPGALYAAGATGGAVVEALRGIMLGAARGLQYLHAQAPPVYHRDLKPDNVLLFQDEHGHVISAKLGDFGAAKVVCCCHPPPPLHSLVCFAMCCSN